jgi:fucose permease
MGYQMAVAYTGTTLLPPLFGLLASHTGTASFPMVVLVMFVLMLICAETVNRLIVKPQQAGR